VTALTFLVEAARSHHPLAAPGVTVGVINYNGMAHLPETLDYVLKTAYPDYQILVVDNGSTDGSREWLQRWLKETSIEARVIFLDQNIGSAGARQRIIEESTGPYVFFLDNDILVEPETLSVLVEKISSVVGAAASHPEIIDPLDPFVYHYNGGWMNYLGVYISRPKPCPGKARPEYESFPVISGGALLVSRPVALEIGGFDPDFFFNMEDGDFTARLSLAGYRCLNVPAARVRHRSRPRGASKVYFQVRNRLFFMTKLYSLRTLLLSLPMLLLFEISQAGMLFALGRGREYLRGSLDYWRHLPALLRKRWAYQKKRRVRDRDWLAAGEMYTPPSLIRSPAARMLIRFYSRFYDAYWRLICPLC
jgi:GT2 family glycosyltransferase